MLRTGALSARGRAAAARLLAALPKHNASKVAGTTVNEWIAARQLPDDAAALVHVLVRVSTCANAPDVLGAGAVVQQLATRSRASVISMAVGRTWSTVSQHPRPRPGAKIIDHAGVNGIERTGSAWELRTSAGDMRAASVVLAAGGPDVAARVLGVESSVVGDPGQKARVTCLDLGLGPPPAMSRCCSRPMLRCISPRTCPPPGSARPARWSCTWPSTSYPTARPLPRWVPADCGITLAQRESSATVTPVLASRYLHNMTVTYGIPQARLGGLRGRPSVAVAGMPGIFLAGDWVGREGMLADAAMASAKHAAVEAVRRAALVTP